MMPIITRAQAIGFGLARYFTGKKCSRGHIAERHCPGGNCIECAKMWSSITKRTDRYRRARAKSRDYYRKRAGYPEPTRPSPDGCEICGNPCITGRVLALDHDHVTGKFRGWLCGKHNMALGAMGDIDTLQKAIEYLRRANAG